MTPFTFETPLSGLSEVVPAHGARAIEWANQVGVHEGVVSGCFSLETSDDRRYVWRVLDSRWFSGSSYEVSCNALPPCAWIRLRREASGRARKLELRHMYRLLGEPRGGEGAR